MFISLGSASGTQIGVEASRVGTSPRTIDGPSGPEVVQDAIYDITSCTLVRGSVKRLATREDRISARPVMPTDIAGDLTVTYRFENGEVLVVTLDESAEIQQVRPPRSSQLGVVLPSIAIHWRDRTKRTR